MRLERHGLADMDGAIILHEHHRLARAARAGAPKFVQFGQQRDEIAATLGSTGLHDEPAFGKIKRADHGNLAGLSRRFDPQVSTAFGPGMGEILLASWGREAGTVAKKRSAAF